MSEFDILEQQRSDLYTLNSFFKQNPGVTTELKIFESWVQKVKHSELAIQPTHPNIENAWTIIFSFKDDALFQADNLYIYHKQLFWEKTKFEGELDNNSNAYQSGYAYKIKGIEKPLIIFDNVFFNLDQFQQVLQAGFICLNAEYNLITTYEPEPFVTAIDGFGLPTILSQDRYNYD